jgi:hypothetical protein
MLLSMQVNAGLISLVYPLTIFGYALLEETRPNQHFWRLIKQYTTCLLAFKFLWNLSALNDYTTLLIPYEGVFRFGLRDYDSSTAITFYLLPELLIITTLYMHEIHLRLIGMANTREDEIEDIVDAIQRNINKDEEAVKCKKNERMAMCLSRYFISRYEQV